jgi:hypothetical protein
MLRRRSIHPQEAEASSTFLSDPGDLSYLPTGPNTDPLLFNRSVDDSRLARSTAVSTNFKRSPSVPAVVSLEEPDTPKRPSSQISDGHSDEARLGLPERWVIYPVSRHGGHASHTPKRGHDDIDFAKFDFTLLMHLPQPRLYLHTVPVPIPLVNSKILHHHTTSMTNFHQSYRPSTRRTLTYSRSPN